jgi:hypothetical protein
VVQWRKEEGVKEEIADVSWIGEANGRQVKVSARCCIEKLLTFVEWAKRIDLTPA